MVEVHDRASRLSAVDIPRANTDDGYYAHFSRESRRPRASHLVALDASAEPEINDASSRSSGRGVWTAI